MACIKNLFFGNLSTVRTRKHLSSDSLIPLASAAVARSFSSYLGFIVQVISKIKILCCQVAVGAYPFLFTQVGSHLDEFEQEQNISGKSAEMKIFNFGIKEE
jgi:hypothetical protein